MARGKPRGGASRRIKVGHPHPEPVVQADQLLGHWYECPEFIPMKSAVTGEDLMLLYGCYRTPEDAKTPFNSHSCYQLGRFDGKTFTRVTEHSR